MRAIDDIAADLGAGRTTSRTLVEEALARIADPAGEGARVFIKVQAEQARAMADAADALRKVGRAAGPYAGIPIALKDLFDIAGEPTPAGSAVLADAPPAAANAPVVARMLAAGFIPMGRANMTEFAFSGLGINPHYGTPSSPWDRASSRIPGGSSSGTGVAVADGMAAAGLGTDTGGSCRIPAAFCGVVGYKPTARRVPIDGVLPLAPSLDSVGPLAPTVACCAEIDAILAGGTPRRPTPASLEGLRLAVPENTVLEGLDATVSAAFDRALAVLSQAGVRIVRTRFAPFEELPAVNAKGGFAASEAYAWHKPLLAAAGDGYDQRIRLRIARGEHMSAADYLALVQARRRLIAAFDAATAPFDAVVMPTVPIVAPPIAELDDERAYNSINMLILRNTALGNFFDRCAISLPCHRPGDAPVGLMLMGETMGDARLFSIAAAAEAALAA
ncbi:MAG TPA: amidase [Rhodopila sp.]|uniref:amidase n=1 Tax=Rhodopila sp. TaxID=2480087 RepID=UPI002BFCB947|nr:amidase [Rhodopila sp.]HVY16034.1 amidase [Rhodopila sp.]